MASFRLIYFSQPLAKEITVTDTINQTRKDLSSLDVILESKRKYFINYLWHDNDISNVSEIIIFSAEVLKGVVRGKGGVKLL